MLKGSAAISSLHSLETLDLAEGSEEAAKDDMGDYNEGGCNKDRSEVRVTTSGGNHRDEKDVEHHEDNVHRSPDLGASRCNALYADDRADARGEGCEDDADDAGINVVDV